MSYSFCIKAIIIASLPLLAACNTTTTKTLVLSRSADDMLNGGPNGTARQADPAIIATSAIVDNVPQGRIFRQAALVRPQTIKLQNTNPTFKKPISSKDGTSYDLTLFDRGSHREVLGSVGADVSNNRVHADLVPGICKGVDLKVVDLEISEVSGDRRNVKAQCR
jgi:hypothetical protein